MPTTRALLASCGRPVSYYSDRYSVFRVNRNGGEGELTQFGRALRTPDIAAIHAHSPALPDAVDDFKTGTANHIAVVSNDSDFGALLIKIKELAAGAGHTNQPPFLWINLPGAGGLSKEIEDFVPEPLRWTITSVPQPEPKNPSKPVESKGDHHPANATIVRWLLKEIPPGRNMSASYSQPTLSANFGEARPAAKTASPIVQASLTTLRRRRCSSASSLSAGVVGLSAARVSTPGQSRQVSGAIVATAPAPRDGKTLSSC